MSFAVCTPQSKELTEPEGQFTSPGYPGIYSGDQTCTWHITVTDGRLIELQVQIVDMKSGTRCLADYIQASKGQ